MANISLLLKSDDSIPCLSLVVNARIEYVSIEAKVVNVQTYLCRTRELTQPLADLGPPKRQISANYP